MHTLITFVTLILILTLITCEYGQHLTLLVCASVKYVLLVCSVLYFPVFQLMCHSEAENLILQHFILG